jgi:hypothetical protein
MSIIRLDTDIVTDLITRPSNTTQYADGDAISEVTTNDHFTFDRAGKAGGRMSGSIDSATIVSSNPAATAPTLDLMLFAAQPDEVADNSAFDPTDAEMQGYATVGDNIANLIGVITFQQADFKKLTNNMYCHYRNLGLTYKVFDTTNISANWMPIYGQLVARSAYTPASAETFQVNLHITRD